MAPKKYLGLDVGERRVGVAVGDGQLRTAWPHSTLIVDAKLADNLKSLLQELQPTDIVVGRPRNQRGEPTEQTQLVEDFVRRVLSPINLPLHWQDESVTSVVAEQRLRELGKPYKKEDIDAQAAAIILQDFLEAL